MKEHKKLGVALVGLGRYSLGQLAPALQQTQNCYLAGVVSGSLEKRQQWQEKYHLEHKNLYSYENFDEIKDNADIDVVYVVLPNALHADYVIRAAKAGKHVICEKPIAVSVTEAQLMIDACREADVKFSMGYRLHFDPFNQEMMRLGQEKKFGNMTKIVADNSMVIDEYEWRLDGFMAGGGPLMNNGVYCVQAAIYITGELPVAVTASFAPSTKPDFFRTVEEGIRWEMEFPDGKKALCNTSYIKDTDLLRAEAERGWFQLDPAYEYKDLKGTTSVGPMRFPTVSQQGAQMDDFARSILEDTEIRVPGEMGMRDLEIIMAIYQSAKSGKRVELDLTAYQNLAEA